MTDDKAAEARERELFEAQYVPLGWERHRGDMLKKFSDGDYCKNFTQDAWRVWQAARASLLARITELEAQVASATN